MASLKLVVENSEADAVLERATATRLDLLIDDANTYADVRFHEPS